MHVYSHRRPFRAGAVPAFIDGLDRFIDGLYSKIKQIKANVTLSLRLVSGRTELRWLT
jgi:hypothetical protein